jgi:hypothetical protein
MRPVYSILTTTITGLLALSLCLLSAHASQTESFSEERLGNLVAVERSFSFSMRTCEKELEKSSGRYACRVDLLPASIHDHLITHPSFSYESEYCKVSIIARPNGYTTFVWPQRNVDLPPWAAINCIREAADHHKLLDEKQIKITLHTLLK